MSGRWFIDAIWSGASSSVWARLENHPAPSVVVGPHRTFSECAVAAERRCAELNAPPRLEPVDVMELFEECPKGEEETAILRSGDRLGYMHSATSGTVHPYWPSDSALALPSALKEVRLLRPRRRGP